MAEEESRKIESSDIAKIIAVISQKYLDSSVKSQVNKLLREDKFWEAVDKAKFREGEQPGQQIKLMYDSSTETLEPFYFWILDKTGDFYKKVDKLVDNFASSPGSGHFSELMGKTTVMQKEAMNIMATVNTIIKSIMNLIYDLKEFEIRLSQYKLLKSKKKEEVEAGILGLKQIWLDNVDIKRGAGSINGMTRGDLMFVTLRDAFMAVKTVKDVEELDLNDRVKRVLKPRVAEFLEWKDRSEKELSKRYEIEKTYLKSQLSALKLYSRWAKPYLKAATQLEQAGISEAGLVNAFNTIVFQLTLLGTNPFDFHEAVLKRTLPSGFENYKLKRDYFGCVLLEFNFRGIPQKVGQHYTFGGKSEVTMRALALNQEEIDLLKKKLEESDLNFAMKLVTGMTEDSLKEMQEDIDHFLKEEKEKKEKSPFSGLFSRKEEKKEKEEKVKKIKQDSYIEKLVREVAENSARESTFKIFDVYKKAHGMASHPDPWDYNR